MRTMGKSAESARGYLMLCRGNKLATILSTATVFVPESSVANKGIDFA